MDKQAGAVRSIPAYSHLFVPKQSDVMSAAVLASVFEDSPIPFAVNADGSVSESVFIEWLNDVGARALAAFEDFSEPALPLKKAARV